MGNGEMIPPSPEQTAKEIVETLISDMDSRVWTEEDEKRILQMLAAALRSYGEACVKENAGEPFCCCRFDDSPCDCKIGVRRATLEEAAKVAEDWIRDHTGYPSPAAKIRALLPPEVQK